MGKYISEAQLSGSRNSFSKDRRRRIKPREADAHRQSSDEGGADEDEGSKKTVFAAMAANLAIAATKFGAALMTGSSSMLAEGIHSVIDTFNQVMLLIGMKRAKKPADEQHPFGYGAEIYFWAFMVAIFLFALGSGFSIYEGVEGLISGESGGLESPLVALGVLFIAFCFEGYSWSVAFKEFRERRKGEGLWADFRRLKDPSVFVVLFEDSAACIGIIIAALGITLAITTGIEAFDAIGSILIGVLLGVTAILLAIEVKHLLIGETADPEIERAIQERVGGREEIVAINELRTLHLGPNDVLLTMSVDFQDDVRAGRIEEIVTEIEAEVKDAYKIVRKVYVEVQSAAGHQRFVDPREGEGAAS
ncbi:cation diffusion facilitator family transporter [Fulvimarina endophytica]|uniref:Cation diffusion facilitator family transporter n=1 Tax=Fulvimarina endophytica TaxID=2293836 RepID=A0A371X7E6_9HYPH|nr:cation diffusion facilitator family transporter [Fulvimarina endophytica]RFC65165.1 cation diffusion facilitator family transporter [Fulvimarina endophytica]